MSSSTSAGARPAADAVVGDAGVQQLRHGGDDGGVGLVDGVLDRGVVQRFAEAVLDPDVGGECLEPGGERLERPMSAREDLVDRVDQFLHVVPVHGQDQVLACREVPVQRPGAHARPLGDLVHRDGGGLGQQLVRDLQDRDAVACGGLALSSVRDGRLVWRSWTHLRSGRGGALRCGELSASLA